MRQPVCFSNDRYGTLSVINELLHGTEVKVKNRMSTLQHINAVIYLIWRERTRLNKKELLFL